MPKPRGSTKPSPLEVHIEALHRLEKKVSEWPLLSSPEGILLDDLFNYKPEELADVPDKGERRLYLTRPVWVNGQRKRSSVFGRWKARDGKHEIQDLERRPLGSVQRRPLGSVQLLNYYKAEHPEKREKRTKWAMTEYTLDSSRIPRGVNELTLCIIYWTKDCRRNETSCGKNLKAKTPPDDGGTSSHPSSKPAVQAEDQVVEHTDLHFLDRLASMEFPLDPIMDWVNDPWFKGYYGNIFSGCDSQE